MKHASGLSITLAAIWVLAGCAILEPRTKESAPTHVYVSAISEGYALQSAVDYQKRISGTQIVTRKNLRNVQAHGHRTGNI